MIIVVVIKRITTVAARAAVMAVVMAVAMAVMVAVMAAVTAIQQRHHHTIVEIVIVIRQPVAVVGFRSGDFSRIPRSINSLVGFCCC